MIHGCHMPLLLIGKALHFLQMSMSCIGSLIWKKLTFTFKQFNCQLFANITAIPDDTISAIWARNKKLNKQI